MRRRPLELACSKKKKKKKNKIKLQRIINKQFIKIGINKKKIKITKQHGKITKYRKYQYSKKGLSLKNCKEYMYVCM